MEMGKLSAAPITRLGLYNAGSEEQSSPVVNNTDEWIPAKPKLPLRLYNAGSKKRWGQAAIDADGWAWWRKVDNEPWLRAAFHHILREAMIFEASHQGAYRTWTVEKEKYSRGDCGPWGKTDVTAYHPQQNWSVERAHRPPKTFQIERRPSSEPTYPIQIWVWRGIVVLDPDGFPLRDFKAIPATLSSEEDGCFLEGMTREDPRITWRDLSARMPVRNPGSAPQPPGLYEPVMTNTGAAMRRLRFRMSAGCIAWKPRQRSKELGQQIQALLPLECLRANSTRGLRRDLTQEEIESIEAACHRKDPPKSSEDAGKLAQATLEKKQQKSKRKAITEPEHSLKKLKPDSDEDRKSDTVVGIPGETTGVAVSDTEQQRYVAPDSRRPNIDSNAQVTDGPLYYTSDGDSHGPGDLHNRSFGDGQSLDEVQPQAIATGFGAFGTSFYLDTSSFTTAQFPDQGLISQETGSGFVQRPAATNQLPSSEIPDFDLDYGTFLNDDFLEELPRAMTALGHESSEGVTASSSSHQIDSSEDPILGNWQDYDAAVLDPSLHPEL